LKWVYQNGCPWDESTTMYAAMSGDVEIFKFL